MRVRVRRGGGLVDAQGRELAQDPSHLGQLYGGQHTQRATLADRLSKVGGGWLLGRGLGGGRGQRWEDGQAPVPAIMALKGSECEAGGAVVTVDPQVGLPLP